MKRMSMIKRDRSSDCSFHPHSHRSVVDTLDEFASESNGVPNSEEFLKWRWLYDPSVLSLAVKSLNKQNNENYAVKHTDELTRTHVILKTDVVRLKKRSFEEKNIQSGEDRKRLYLLHETSLLVSTTR